MHGESDHKQSLALLGQATNLRRIATISVCLVIVAVGALIYGVSKHDSPAAIHQKQFQANDPLLETHGEQFAAYFSQAQQEQQLAMASGKSAEEFAKHMLIAMDALQKAAEYSLIDGRETSATAGCYALAAFQGMTIGNNETAREKAWQFANKARILFEKSRSIPGRYDVGLPAPSIGKAQTYQVLCYVYAEEPKGHGSLEDALKYGMESIKLYESDIAYCSSAALSAKFLVSILVREGRTAEARTTLDEVAEALSRSEKNNQFISTANAAGWLQISQAYNQLGEKNKADRAMLRKSKIERMIGGSAY